MNPMPTPRDPHQFYYHEELSPDYKRWPGDEDTQAIRELDDIVRGWQGYPKQIKED